MKKKLLSCLSALFISLLFSTSVFAAIFSSSPTKNPAPKLIKVEMIDTHGEVTDCASYGNLIVTSLSYDKNATEDIKDTLEDAYNILKNNPLEVVIPMITERLDLYSGDLSAEDLVVKDIFDVTLIGDAKEDYEKNGGSIRITYDLNIPEDTFYTVGHYSSYEQRTDDTYLTQGGTTDVDKSWYLLDEDKAVRNSDGTLTVETDSLSPFAIITERDTLAVAANAPLSPQTGDETSTVLLLCAASLGAAAFVFYKNKRNRG